jgi:hypothetical protein
MERDFERIALLGNGLVIGFFMYWIVLYLVH